MTAPSPADPLGYDAFLDEDLDAGGRSATGLELVTNAIPHRLMADDLLCIDAPGDRIPFGVDVRKWVGAAVTQDDLDAKIPLVDAALHLDERIAATRITMGLQPASSLVAFTIGIEALTVTGEVISRVVGVSSVSVAFLAGST